jgi:hypothetical protein
MTDSRALVEVTLRVPGRWSHPGKLIEKLPAGYRLTPDALIMPDGTKVEFNPMPPDDQFAGIFRSSCRRPPTEEELGQIDGYTVNVGLSGPGGSLQAARRMMEAGAAIVKAGGLGVFNDNSGLAHGGQNWLYMTEEGSPDAVSFAFVSIVRGKSEMYTTGMHVLGLRDVVMQRADVEEHGFDIVEVIRYLAQGDKPVGDGHVIADMNGPCFQAFAAESPAAREGSPMDNPFGRLKLVSVKDIAGRN